MRIELLLTAAIFVPPLILAGTGHEADTVRVGTETFSVEDSIEIEGLSERFGSNLDSLVNLWYVDNSLAMEPDSGYFPDSVDMQFPDSVYIGRLSKLPSMISLTYNRQVRNYIHVYTGKRRELVENLLGLSDYYFPVFEEIFDMYGIPLELKYCSIIESALNPGAVSRAGATGIWQFMYGTGKMYGLTINSMVDERRDPYKSTLAAARFMKDLYRIYDDWLLVIAAYNCGPGNVNRAIRRSGGKRDFWDIYYYLPRETRGHVPAFVAATYTMNYYKEHGLKSRPTQLPIPVDTVMIRDNLHLDQVAQVLGLSKQMLRDINPQYKWDIIPGREKPYALRIPVEYSMRFIELEDSIFAYKDSIYFNSDRSTKSPAYYTARAQAPSGNYARLTYTVKSGDNLGFISEWYHVRLSDLRYWNNIYGTTIRTGQKLVVFVPKSKLENYAEIDDMSFAGKQRSIGKTVKKSAPGESASRELPGMDEDYILYTVKSGDTLWDIARMYQGVTDSDLIELNDLENGNSIKPGMVIRIRPKG